MIDPWAEPSRIDRIHAPRKMLGGERCGQLCAAGSKALHLLDSADFSIQLPSHLALASWTR
jgi:hypothetical protein